MSPEIGGRQKDKDGTVVLIQCGQPNIPMAGQHRKI